MFSGSFKIHDHTVDNVVYANTSFMATGAICEKSFI